MNKKAPLVIMFLVLLSPFVASLIFIEGQDQLSNKARGQWLSQTHYVDALDDRNWQLLWRKSDCEKAGCADLVHLLERVKLALGKHRDKLSIIALDDQLAVNEIEQNEGLFIANHKGLMLLQYSADDDGAYKLLKDLKVLMKHGGA